MSTGMEAVAYSASNARVRGLYSRLLSSEQWRALVDVPNLEAAVTFLRDTSYSPALEGLTDTPLRITTIEGRLKALVADNTNKCLSLAKSGARQMVLVWLRHFELDNLKVVFRGIAQGYNAEQIESMLIPLSEATTLPWSSLAHELSVPALVDRLQGTHYINPLKNALPGYERDDSLFSIEVALDIRYYRDVWAVMQRLGTLEHKDAKIMMGDILDALNIEWAFRYREYYGLSPEEIVNYTLWHTDRTDANLIREIALGATPREIVDRVFGQNAVDLSGAPTEVSQMLPELELALKRHTRKTAKSLLGGYPFRLGTILAYLVLLDQEVTDLITVIEGKEMGWEPDEIHHYLIRREE